MSSQTLEKNVWYNVRLRFISSFITKIEDNIITWSNNLLISYDFMPSRFCAFWLSLHCLCGMGFSFCSVPLKNRIEKEIKTLRNIIVSLGVALSGWRIISLIKSLTAIYPLIWVISDIFYRFEWKCEFFVNFNLIKTTKEWDLGDGKSPRLKLDGYKAM